MDFRTRVYNPRGNRAGGGGLMATLTVDQETVEAWIGLPGAPSALERVRLERALEKALRRLLVEIVVAMAAQERDRAHE